MFKRFRCGSNGTMLVFSSLVCVLLLVACGNSPSSDTTSTTASTPTQAATPASPTAEAGAMTPYQGNSFTISYPQNWQVSKQANNLFTFTDSTGGIKMTITVTPNPNEVISADSVASAALQAAQVLLKNAQTVSMASTTTVGGDSWSQVSASGTQRLNNQDIAIQVVVIAAVHPAKSLMSKSFTILYQAPTEVYSQIDSTYFQPMLQSFQFT